MSTVNTANTQARSTGRRTSTRRNAVRMIMVDDTDTNPQIIPEWLEYERTHGGRFCLCGTIKEINNQIQDFFEAMKAQNAGSGISLSTHGSLEVHDSNAEGVPIRVYKPTNQTADLPLCLFSHGGGFVFGSLDSEDSMCRLIATETPCTLVSVDYRLGPKYKLPAMVVDLIRVYRWARRPENGLFKQGSKIFAAGRSSGAALSLALANHVAQLPSGDSSARPRLDGVIALAPITLHPNYVPHRYQDIYTSYKENEENVPVIERSTMMTFFDAVKARPQDSSIFTALSADLDKFPATYIVTCGADPLRDDGVVLEALLKDAKVRTIRDHYPGLPHVFWAFPDFAPVASFEEKLIRGIRLILNDT